MTASPHRVVIVPGFGAGPENHWFPWLARTLKGRGVAAPIVRLPEPLHPVRVDWEATVAAALGEPNQSTWIVAHSLGCITSLRVLATARPPWTLGGIVLVAGFSGPLPGRGELDEFLTEEAPAEELADRITVRVAFASSNDPSVPLTTARALADRLRASCVTLPARGHFRARDGVTEFPEIVEAVLGRRNA